MDPALQAWLAPSGLAVVAGAVAWLVRTSIVQDRRLTSAEGLEARLFGDGRGNPGVLSSYVTRESCGNRHAETASRASLGEALDQLRSLERIQAEDRASVKVALERFSSAVDRLDRIEERLSRYFEDSSPHVKRGG